MPKLDDKNWKQLCSDALEAKDSDELLEVVRKLNNALKDEEQINQDLRKRRIGKTSEEAQC